MSFFADAGEPDVEAGHAQGEDVLPGNVAGAKDLEVFHALEETGELAPLLVREAGSDVGSAEAHRAGVQLPDLGEEGAVRVAAERPVDLLVHVLPAHFVRGARDGLHRVEGVYDAVSVHPVGVVADDVHDLREACGPVGEAVHRPRLHLDLRGVEGAAEELHHLPVRQGAKVYHVEDALDRLMGLDHLAAPLLDPTEHQEQGERLAREGVAVHQALHEMGEGGFGRDAIDLVEYEEEAADSGVLQAPLDLLEEAEHAEEEERLREAEGDDEPIDGHHEDDGRDSDRPDADIEPSDDDDDADVPAAETVSGEGEDGNGRDTNAAASALRAKRMALRRRYKIQDVIHRRQVLLVQVVKEERGNKGAALTTYLSLAGRYCVLMPNTTHGGGISRKISNAADRKRLKTIMAELELPKTMGCIVRTAGLQRTKTEIRRDFDYLARVWDTIRETTLKSSAPALIHNDSDLIKRAIRDIYNKDIDEVIVEGEEGYRAAREYMKLLMPSHAKRVQPYSDVVPLFQRYHVEDQLNAMYQPIVQLKSGGYLVINPTEALVSIDINSGRSTREHGIEATAVGTNLEAAQEIARQLRLRDMAGLVVIDFIDMEHGSNVRKVEKAMKAALANDRARIQVGRISSFGLMEMSRQRLRTGVLEASTRQCPHCEGTGLVRTASSAALSALRLLEEEAAKGNGSRLSLRAS